MPRVLLSPKIDFVFKKIFGNEKHPEILISFLNAVMEPTDPIKSVQIKNSDIEKEHIDSIFACGPLPLLKAVQTLAKEKNIPCQISLEERMGCGLGVCLGCAVEVTGGGYEHVCKQGPVFDSKKVII